MLPSCSPESPRDPRDSSKLRRVFEIPKHTAFERNRKKRRRVEWWTQVEQAQPPLLLDIFFWFWFYLAWMLTERIFALYCRLEARAQDPTCVSRQAVFLLGQKCDY